MNITQLIAIGHTRAQALVAEKVLEGKSNMVIADELSISYVTVKSHLTDIYRKFDVQSRAQYIIKMHNTDLSTLLNS